MQASRMMHIAQQADDQVKADAKHFNEQTHDSTIQDLQEAA